MTTKGQNRGHCQVCGRIQVVLPGGVLAKHGYVVAGFGYFKGTCQGSAELPLQVSRIITDAIIKAMNDLGARMEVRAIALGAGKLKPKAAQRLTAWGGRVYQSINGKQSAVMVEWRDATGAERMAQLKLEISEAESHARHARGHAKSLTALAALTHGKPLIDRDEEELARVVARQAKSAPIAGAYRSKAEQKRALEALSRDYSKLRQIITNRYLDDVRRVPRTKVRQEYYDIPHELHQWRAKHTAFVLDRYPELAKTVEAIEILVINRNEIKARPVIT